MSQNTFSIAETFIYNIPSHLTHALFTDIRRFSLVSNLYKMRSRKKVKEERTLVFLHIDGDSLPHDHEPGEKVTGKKKKSPFGVVGLPCFYSILLFADHWNWPKSENTLGKKNLQWERTHLIYPNTINTDYKECWLMYGETWVTSRVTNKIIIWYLKFPESR